MTRQEQFIQDAKQHNKNAIASLLAASPADEDEGNWSDNILSIDKTEVYDICTSTGGPAGGFRVYVRVYENGEREVAYATSYFQDWGTEKYETTLSEVEQAALLSAVYIEGVSE